MKLEPNDPLKKNNFLESTYNNVRKNEKWSADPHPDPVWRKVTIDDWLWVSLVWSLTVSVWRDGTHTVGACPEMSEMHTVGTCPEMPVARCFIIMKTGHVDYCCQRFVLLKIQRGGVPVWSCSVWFGLVSVSLLILHLRLQHGVLVSAHSKHSAKQPNA